MKRLRFLTAGLLASMAASQAGAINIVVDYTYDTNNFFATQASRDAMQAVADRYSAIITSSLSAVSPAGTGTGTSAGWRIGFTHPGTGQQNFNISTAASSGTDPLGGGADVYGFAGLNQDEWILFAGGRALTSAGVGGTGTGLNYSSTFNDPNGPHHRGLISNDPLNTLNDLPVWGGAISFDSSRSWDFSLATAGGAGSDFYSIAMHEVGHALGLSTQWNQWTDYQTGGTFTGPEALAAYNADNGTSVTWLNQASTANRHWQDGTYDSVIFPLANPNYNGTVGPGNLQDLLMEPTANYTAQIDRFEITNTDVGALRDLGWETLASLIGDFDGDGDIDGVDVGTMFTNFNGPGGGVPGNPATDLDGDGDCDGVDVATLFGLFTGPLAPANVPEPGSIALFSLAGLLTVRRRHG